MALLVQGASEDRTRFAEQRADRAQIGRVRDPTIMGTGSPLSLTRLELLGKQRA